MPHYENHNADTCYSFCLGLDAPKRRAQAVCDFDLASGDLASPPQIFTNNNGSHVVYRVQISLSSARGDGVFLKFAKQHPGLETDIVVGPQIITGTRIAYGGQLQSRRWD